LFIGVLKQFNKLFKFLLAFVFDHLECVWLELVLEPLGAGAFGGLASLLHVLEHVQHEEGLDLERVLQFEYVLLRDLVAVLLAPAQNPLHAQFLEYVLEHVRFALHQHFLLELAVGLDVLEHLAELHELDVHHLRPLLDQEVFPEDHHVLEQHLRHVQERPLFFDVLHPVRHQTLLVQTLVLTDRISSHQHHQVAAEQLCRKVQFEVDVQRFNLQLRKYLDEKIQRILFKKRNVVDLLVPELLVDSVFIVGVQLLADLVVLEFEVFVGTLDQRPVDQVHGVLPELLLVDHGLRDRKVVFLFLAADVVVNCLRDNASCEPTIQLCAEDHTYDLEVQLRRGLLTRGTLPDGRHSLDRYLPGHHVDVEVRAVHSFRE